MTAQAIRDVVVAYAKAIGVTVAPQSRCDSGRSVAREHAFEGVIPNLERRHRETDSAQVREELAKYDPALFELIDEGTSHVSVREKPVRRGKA